MKEPPYTDAFLINKHLTKVNLQGYSCKGWLYVYILISIRLTIYNTNNNLNLA